MKVCVTATITPNSRLQVRKFKQCGAQNNAALDQGCFGLLRSQFPFRMTRKSREKTRFCVSPPRWQPPASGQTVLLSRNTNPHPLGNDTVPARLSPRLLRLFRLCQFDIIHAVYIYFLRKSSTMV